MTFRRFRCLGVVCLLASGTAQARDEPLVPVVGRPDHFGVSVRCDMPAGSAGIADLVLDAYGYFK